MSRLAPALALVTLAACATPGPGTGPEGAPAPDGLQADSIQGTVAVVGAEPLTRVLLETDLEPTLLHGDPTDLLRRAHGLTVRVHGRAEGQGFRVDGFRVVRAAGLPAADGLLELDGDTAVLVTATGARIRYPAAPADLRARAGLRVWIAGDPGAEPSAWGTLGGG